jgi:putative membrane protein
MKNFLIRVVTSAIAVAVAAWLFNGITVVGHNTTDRLLQLILVAAIFAIVNAYLKPVAMVLSLPAIILTLGLFFFVVNALLLLFTGWIANQAGIGFHVDGFWTAVFGSIVISIVSWLVSTFFSPDDSKSLRAYRGYRSYRNFRNYR